MPKTPAMAPDAPIIGVTELVSVINCAKDAKKPDER